MRLNPIITQTFATNFGKIRNCLAGWVPVKYFVTRGASVEWVFDRVLRSHRSDWVLGINMHTDSQTYIIYVLFKYCLSRRTSVSHCRLWIFGWALIDSLPHFDGLSFIRWHLKGPLASVPAGDYLYHSSHFWHLLPCHINCILFQFQVDWIYDTRSLGQWDARASWAQPELMATNLRHLPLRYWLERRLDLFGQHVTHVVIFSRNYGQKMQMVTVASGHKHFTTHGVCITSI